MKNDHTCDVERMEGWLSGRDEAITEILGIIRDVEEKPTGFMSKMDTCLLIKQRIKAMYHC